MTVTKIVEPPRLVADSLCLAGKDLPPSSRLPSLDGWRAVAIILVLGFHAEQSHSFPRQLGGVFGFFDGPLGVRFFFIISGFLITWLLVKERDYIGRVRLSSFYIRRALRILPAYVGFLAVLFCLDLITPYHQDFRVWLANLTFTTNFLGACPWPSSHLWSLAVEEQFYLLWPGLFVMLKLAGDLRRSMLVLLVPVAIAPVFRVLSYLHVHPPHFSPPFLTPILTNFSFFNYVDQLAVGCFAALLLAKRRPWLEARLNHRSAWWLLLATLMVAIPHVLNRLLILGPVTVPFGSSVQAAGFGLLLLQSVLRPHSGPYRILNRPFMMWIGVLSYSIYLWQQVFCANPSTFGLASPVWMTFPWWLVATFAAAASSFYLLERPFFRMRRQYR